LITFCFEADPILNLIIIKPQPGAVLKPYKTFSIQQNQFSFDDNYLEASFLKKNVSELFSHLWTDRQLQSKQLSKWSIRHRE